jgi:sigma-B regulation protein RsbU (phosphoserine phosphatase)
MHARPGQTPEDSFEPCVTLVTPGGGNRDFPLNRERLLVGRAPDCAIVIHDDAISRHHAEILRDPFGRWLIHDLGSRNGLKVDGKRVQEQVLLPNVRVRLDKYTLQLTPVLSRGQHEAAPVESDTLDDTADLQFSSMTPGEDARLASSHLFALLELDRLLIAEPDPVARRRVVCAMLVNRPFGARGAVLLRLDRNPAGSAPRTLGDFQVSKGVAPAPFHISRRLLERTLQTNEIVLASNVDNRVAQVQLSISASASPMSAIAAPVRSDANSLDVLYILLAPQSSTQEWLALAALTARHYEQAETLLATRDNAHSYALIEQDLARARGIQQRLLPGPLDLPEIETAWCYEPCRWVGGDYLDTFQLQDGRLFLGLADVCGKGIQAALISSSLHTLIRSLLSGDVTLANGMQRAGRHLSSYLPDGAFVTMLGAIIDSSNGACEFVNAGHPELLHIDSNGGIHPLPGGVNLPLGVSDEELLTQHLSLARGDSLLMYTDGWPDVIAPSGDPLNEERFLGFIQQSFEREHALTPQSHLQRIDAAVESFRGSAIPNDDRAMLLARWRLRQR